MIAPIPEGAVAYLLVEGKDDLNFCRHLLLKHIGVNQNGITHAVMDAGSKNEIRPALRFLSKDPRLGGLTQFAIIRDADDDLKGARQSVCDALRDAGFPVPTGLGKDHAATGAVQPPGTAVQVAKDLTVSVYLWPNCRDTGELETLRIRALRPSLKPVEDCVRAMITCARDSFTGDPDLKKDFLKKPDKTRVFTLALLQRDTKLFLEEETQRDWIQEQRLGKLLNPDHGDVMQLLDYLRWFAGKRTPT